MEDYFSVSIQQNFCHFQKTIREVQKAYLRDITNKRQALQVKNKLRNDWIKKKQIIPIKYKFSENDNSMQSKARLFQYRKYPQIQSKRYTQDLFQQFMQNRLLINQQTRNQSIPQKQERYSVMVNTKPKMKTSNNQLRIKKKKINWKLQYRKDQINVLKYLSTCQSPNSNQCVRYHSNYAQNYIDKIPSPKMLYRKIKNEQQISKKNSEQEINVNKQCNNIKEQKKGRTSVLIKH